MRSTRYIMLRLLLVFCIISVANLRNTQAQIKYQFKIIKQIPTTTVKDQARTGTCWSFATTSFIESEMIRMGKSPVDLSEMFSVYHTYLRKAELFVSSNGKSNLSSGALSHDVTYIARNYGIIPNEVYTGLECGSTSHNHNELDNAMVAYCGVVIKSDPSSRSCHWNKVAQAILNAYLGEAPTRFQYAGKTYTPISFRDEVVGFNPDDYVEITSYSHHPYYQEFALEIPDNWSNDKYYNLPMDELVEVMNSAIDKGYTIAWDGDVSEKEFMHSKGVAIVPEKDWRDKNEKERENTCVTLESEKKITQQLRQETYENKTTTDDHLMHITGIATDTNGTKYYLTKNSWGSESNSYEGYLYMSEAYIRLKTVGILVHKDAIPANIAKKLFN